MGMNESLAQGILAQAIKEHRCAELLDCLFDGGGVTIDANTGDLVLITAEMVAALAGEA